MLGKIKRFFITLFCVLGKFRITIQDSFDGTSRIPRVLNTNPALIDIDQVERRRNGTSNNRLSLREVKTKLPRSPKSKTFIHRPIKTYSYVRLSYQTAKLFKRQFFNGDGDFFLEIIFLDDLLDFFHIWSPIRGVQDKESFFWPIMHSLQNFLQRHFRHDGTSIDNNFF